MPDQSRSLNLTPAERRSVKSLTRMINSDTPLFSRDEDGVLMARTGWWLYRFNAAEGRWNDAGRVPAEA